VRSDSPPLQPASETMAMAAKTRRTQIWGM
jgi:hypothetical protein